MKQILSFIGAAVYGLLLSYFLWFGFLHLDDWTMTFGWTGVIIFLIVCTPIMALLSYPVTWATIPLVMLIRICRHAKWLPLVFMLFHCISSLRLPWLYYSHYTAPHIVMAVVTDIIVLVIFGAVSFAILGADKLGED